VHVKTCAGRGESPYGYGENVLGSEPQGKEWAILTQASKRRKTHEEGATT